MTRLLALSGTLALSGALVPTAAAAPVVEAYGSCPGTPQLEISRLTPRGDTIVVSSVAYGGATVPAGPCAGTSLGLAGPVTVLDRGDASGAGTLVAELDVPPDACGRLVRVVDLATCDVSDVLRLPNTPPTAFDVAVGPDPALPCDTLHCDVVRASYDPDGTPVSYRFEWTVDGLPAGEGPTLPPGTAQVGQEVACRAVATDGYAQSPAALARPVVVEDRLRNEVAFGTGDVDLLFLLAYPPWTDGREALTDEAAGLLAALDARGFGYQIGTTSAHVQDRRDQPTGALFQADGVRFVDPFTARPADRLEALLDGPVLDGSNRPLNVLQTALSPVREPENHGFIRDGAALGVVILSEIDDEGSAPVPELLDGLATLRGDLDHTRIWTISGGLTGCSPPTGADADPAPRLVDAAIATGGADQSICATPYGAFLDQMVADLPRGVTDRRALDFEPVRGTLDVTYVDPAGIPRPLVGGTDYRYLAREVAVQLRREPAEGSTLEFSYEAACRP